MLRRISRPIKPSQAANWQPSATTTGVAEGAKRLAQKKMSASILLWSKVLMCCCLAS